MEVRTPLLNAQRTKQRLTTTEQVSIYKYLEKLLSYNVRCNWSMAVFIFR